MQDAEPTMNFETVDLSAAVNITDSFVDEFVRSAWKNRLFQSSVSLWAAGASEPVETVISDLQTRLSVARANQEIDEDLLTLLAHLEDWLNYDSHGSEALARALFSTYVAELAVLAEYAMELVQSELGESEFSQRVQKLIENMLWMAARRENPILAAIVHENLPTLLKFTFAGDHKDYDLLYTAVYYENFPLASKILQYGATIGKSYSCQYLITMASTHWSALHFLHAVGLLSPILKHPANLARLDGNLAKHITEHTRIEVDVKDVGLINYIVAMFKPLLLDALHANDEEQLWQLNEIMLRQCRILAVQKYSGFDSHMLNELTSRAVFTKISPTLDICIPAIRVHQILWSKFIWDSNGNVCDIDLQYSEPVCGSHKKMFVDCINPFCIQLIDSIIEINADACSPDIKAACYNKISGAVMCMKLFVEKIHDTIQSLGIAPNRKGFSSLTLLDLLIENPDPNEVQQRLLKYQPLIQEKTDPFHKPLITELRPSKVLV